MNPNNKRISTRLELTRYKLSNNSTHYSQKDYPYRK